MRRLCSWSVLLGVAVLAACVEPPPERADDGWITIEPGQELSLVIEDSAGRLDGIGLEVPAGAVSETTSIRLALAESTAPVFAMAGQQLRTPAVFIEPYNITFSVTPILVLPWYALGETDASAWVVRGYRAPSVAGIPEGLWRPVTPETDLPHSVRLPLVGGGLFWAATLEDAPLREPAEVIGEPCLPAESTFDACTVDPDCGAVGCLADRCGKVGPVSTACRPVPRTALHFGCACRCAVGACQWVR